MGLRLRCSGGWGSEYRVQGVGWRVVGLVGENLEQASAVVVKISEKVGDENLLITRPA